MGKPRPLARIPLRGIRVIDLSSFLAPPLTSMFFGDFGADVIKVERPERAMSPVCYLSVLGLEMASWLWLDRVRR